MAGWPARSLEFNELDGDGDVVTRYTWGHGYNSVTTSNIDIFTTFIHNTMVFAYNTTPTRAIRLNSSHSSIC